MTKEFDDFFVDANEDLTRRKIVWSPSGKLALEVRSYTTGEGTWNYTRGIITTHAMGDVHEVADIKRDYSSFTHSFIEVDGHELLVTGRSYLTQTVVDLTTGKIYEGPQPEGEGHEFCWVKCTLLPNKVLQVDGCYWACPYEHKFFDLSKLLSDGIWPEIPVVDEKGEVDCMYDEEGRDLEVKDLSDGMEIIANSGRKIFKPLNLDENEIDMEVLDKITLDPVLNAAYEDETEVNYEFTKERITTYKLLDGKIKPINAWRSERAIEADKQWKEYREKEKIKLQGWNESDLVKGVLDRFKPLGETTSHYYYPSQNSVKEGETNPGFLTAYVKVAGRTMRSDLEVGIDHGDFKITCYDKDRKSTTKIFDRTDVDGVVKFITEWKE